MRAEGGEAWKLTDAKEAISAYTWSPDSARLAYVTTEPRSPDQEADHPQARRRAGVRRRFPLRAYLDHRRRIEGDVACDRRNGMDRSWHAVVVARRKAPDVCRRSDHDAARSVERMSTWPITASKQVEKISTQPGVRLAARMVSGWRVDRVAFRRTGMGRPLPDGTIAVDYRPEPADDLRRARRSAPPTPAALRFRYRRRRAAMGARQQEPSFSPPASAPIPKCSSFDLGTRQYTQLTQQKTLQLGSRARTAASSR